MLRESPWYLEIEAEPLQRGVQQSVQQGQAGLLLRLLNRRFGATPPWLAERVRSVPSEQMPALLDVALTAASLDEVATAVEVILTDAGPVAA
ncbi:MAG: DUF4351 domain-containing protein [Anaerolineae bacterium]